MESTRMSNSIGIIIKYYRKKLGVSQNNLCKGICVPSYLSKIENGEIVPSEAMILDLAERLDITFDIKVDYIDDFDLCDAAIKALFNLRKKEAQECYETIGRDLSLTKKAYEYLALKYYFESDLMIKSILEKTIPFLDETLKPLIALIIYSKEETDTHLLNPFYESYGYGYFLKGMLAFKQKNYKNAYVYYQQSEMAYFKEGYLQGMFYSIKQQGMLMAFAEKFEDALNCFERLHRMIEETGSKNFEVIERTTYYNLHYIRSVLKLPNALEVILVDYIKEKKYSNSVMFHMLFELTYTKDADYAKKVLFEGLDIFSEENTWNHQLLQMDLRKLEDPKYTESELYYLDLKKQIQYSLNTNNHYAYNTRVKELIEYLKLNRRYKEAFEMLESLITIEL